MPAQCPLLFHVRYRFLIPFTKYYMLTCEAVSESCSCL